MQPDNMQSPTNIASSFSAAQPVAASPNQPYNTSLSGNPYQAGIPQIADDGDLIEEEWVAAAKRIIEENRRDPFAQNQAMNALRKDYMKKRYGEDIKTAG